MRTPGIATVVYNSIIIYIISHAHTHPLESAHFKADTFLCWYSSIVSSGSSSSRFVRSYCFSVLNFQHNIIIRAATRAHDVRYARRREGARRKPPARRDSCWRPCLCAKQALYGVSNTPLVRESVKSHDRKLLNNMTLSGIMWAHERPE